MEDISKEYKSDYFETLPLHPPPNLFESISSYLRRLAEANGFQSLARFAPFGLPMYTLSKLPDFPLSSFGDFPSVTLCSEDTLRATTFYNLCNKFGQYSVRHSLDWFLRNSITHELCYCPYCLIHSPYYSLKWRFKILTSCYEHNCQLLNICTHCGERILFNQFIPSVTQCPLCNRDLRTCKVQSLTEEMQQQSLECSRDLEFLLTPQPWEQTVDNLEQRLGQQLAHLRQKKGLPLNLVASELELHLWEIEHIEHVMYGYLGPGRIKLQTYFKYAAYLGVTIPELFQGAFQQKVEQASPKGVLCDEDAFNRVQEAIQILKARGEKITQENICRQVQMNMPLLAKFPRTREFVKSKSSIIRLTPEERERVSAELRAQVQSAVKQLKESGQRITQVAIGKLIGRKPHEFRYYPQILEYFRYLGIVNPESEQSRLIVNSKRQRLMTSKLMK